MCRLNPETKNNFVEESREINFNLILTIRDYIVLLNECSKLKLEKRRAISKEVYEKVTKIEKLEKEKSNYLNEVFEVLNHFYKNMEFKDMDAVIEFDFFEIILSKNISEIQDSIASETNFMMREDLDFKTNLYQKKHKANQIELSTWHLWRTFLKIRKKRIENIHGSRREVRLIDNLLSSAHVKRITNYR